MIEILIKVHNKSFIVEDATKPQVKTVNKMIIFTFLSEQDMEIGLHNAIQSWF